MKKLLTPQCLAMDELVHHLVWSVGHFLDTEIKLYTSFNVFLIFSLYYVRYL